MKLILSPEQSRAARGWLDWSQAELASRAHVGLSTVRDFEKGRHIPIDNNLLAMRKAFKDVGMDMIFDEDGAPLGVACDKAEPSEPLA